MTKPLYVAGQTYGRLTAVRDVGSNGSRRLWEFRCSCGNTIIRTTNPVRRGLTQSCGCLAHERAVEMGKTYGPIIGGWNLLPLDVRFKQFVDLENRALCLNHARDSAPAFYGQETPIAKDGRNCTSMTPANVPAMSRGIWNMDTGQSSFVIAVIIRCVSTWIICSRAITPLITMTGA